MAEDTEPQDEVDETPSATRHYMTPSEREKYGAEFRWKYNIRDRTWEMPALQREFLEEYLLDPEAQQRCTQAQWAKDHGVDNRTITRWKKDERFLAEWKLRMDETWTHPSKMQKVIHTLIQIGGDPNHPQCVSAIDKYLKLIDKISPPKVTIEVKPDASLEQFTNDQLYEMIRSRQPDMVQLERA